MRRFVCTLTIPGIGTMAAEGPNKKAAKHNVSQNALSQLDSEWPEQEYTENPYEPNVESEMEPSSGFPTEVSSNSKKLKPSFDSGGFPLPYADTPGYTDFTCPSDYPGSFYPMDNYCPPNSFAYNSFETPYDAYGWMAPMPMSTPVPSTKPTNHISTVPPFQPSAIPYKLPFSPGKVAIFLHLLFNTVIYNVNV